MREDHLRSYKLAFVLTLGLFFLWGIGRSLYDNLVVQFATAFKLGGPQLMLILGIYSLFYFLFAVPAAIYARSFGSKAGIVFGLGCWCIGAFLFYPTAQAHELLFFLSAVAVMTTGYVFVEMTMNPIVARMGSPEHATARLNFAHGLYPLGLLAVVCCARWLAFSDLVAPIARFGVRPYMVIGVAGLLLAFVIDKVRFPAFATERGKSRDAMQEFRTLLRRPMFVSTIGAQLCTGAAMAVTWTLGLWYIAKEIPGATPSAYFWYLTTPLILFAAGRLIGALLMLRVSPEILLALFSLSGVVFAGVAAFGGGQVGSYALIAVSFSMSIMFATVLGIGIRGLGPLTGTGTALIYSGGSGGALGLGAMYLVWTNFSVNLAMVVPMACFAAVLAFAMVSRLRTAAQEPAMLAQAAE